MFSFVKNSEFNQLKALCSNGVENDVDNKKVREVAPDKEFKKNYVEYFGKGRINGTSIITVDNAAVKIIFEPQGTCEETLNMIRKDGKGTWPVFKFWEIHNQL